MASRDLLTFYQIAYSEDIKRGLKAQNYTPVNSHTAVSKAVSKYALEVKNDIRATLKERISQGLRFSISLDEFTAKNHKRYSEFNVHFPEEKPKSIGMVRVHGSLDAEAAADLCEEKLREFGLSTKRHIVAGATDGASVMVKMGESLPIIHQICLTHGIHLAVVDVIYKVSLSNDLF